MDTLKGHILLTGGAGFLGQHIKNKLLEHGALKKNITIPRSRVSDLRHLKVCQEIMVSEVEPLISDSAANDASRAKSRDNY